jgi:BON domain
MMRYLSLFLLLLMAPLAPAAPAAPSRTVVAPARSDAEIERAIKARFARSKVSRNNFQVHVQGGIATLEGMTDVVQHKGAATRMAKTAGARAVVNHIKVSEAARQKAAGQLAKARRATVRAGE